MCFWRPCRAGARTASISHDGRPGAQCPLVRLPILRWGCVTLFPGGCIATFGWRLHGSERRRGRLRRHDNQRPHGQDDSRARCHTSTWPVEWPRWAGRRHCRDEIASASITKELVASAMGSGKFGILSSTTARVFHRAITTGVELKMLGAVPKSPKAQASASKP